MTPDHELAAIGRLATAKARGGRRRFIRSAPMIAPGQPLQFALKRFPATMAASGFAAVWVPPGGRVDFRLGVVLFP